MIGSVICALGDSDSARSATRVARALSTELGLNLVFVRVVEDGTRRTRIDKIATRLQSLRDAATDVDTGAKWSIEVGEPVDRLLAAAAANDARLIVLGAPDSYRPGHARIDAELSSRAPCPVVVVPETAPASASPLGASPGPGSRRAARRSPWEGSKGAGWRAEALMRWEWEGGTPAPANDEAAGPKRRPPGNAAEAAAPFAIR